MSKARVWRTNAVRVSTVVRRMRASNPHEVLSDRIEQQAAAFTCPTCNRAEPDPCVGELPSGLVFGCPHCAGDAVRAAWEADAPDAFRCPHPPCAKGFHVDDLAADWTVPTHDFPKPRRQVCPGSGMLLARKDAGLSGIVVSRTAPEHMHVREMTVTGPDAVGIDLDSDK